MTTVSDITPPLELAIPKRYASTQEVADRRAAFYAALRSGQYKQGHNCLSTPIEGEMRYCCLGVACEVSGLDRWFQRPGTSLRFYMGLADTLPHEVSEYYEFWDSNPTLNVPAELRIGYAREGEAAAALNDALGLSFVQIAECFEATYPASVAPVQVPADA